MNNAEQTSQRSTERGADASRKVRLELSAQDLKSLADKVYRLMQRDLRLGAAREGRL